MNEDKYIKFKNNNLPTPYNDEEKGTLDYISYNDDNYYNDYNILHAMENLSHTNLYYSFNSGYFDGDNIKHVGHTHGHSFDEVLTSLYNFPESFSIDSNDEIYYSKQELEFIRRVHKYLLFIKLKDINLINDNDRYNNLIHNKFKDCSMHNYKNSTIDKFINNERNYVVLIPNDISIYSNSNIDYKELMLDEEDNIRLYVEYINREIKEYKDIKDKYINNDLKDNDKVVVEYFKVLEIFN